MSMPGPYELIIILLIILLLFGGRKIPEIARGLGKGLREFRKARDEVMEEARMDEEENEQASNKEFNASRAENEPPAESEENND